MPTAFGNLDLEKKQHILSNSFPDSVLGALHMLMHRTSEPVHNHNFEERSFTHFKNKSHDYITEQESSVD
jgi:hypothetical protein